MKQKYYNITNLFLEHTNNKTIIFKGKNGHLIIENQEFEIKNIKAYISTSIIIDFENNENLHDFRNKSCSLSFKSDIWDINGKGNLFYDKFERFYFAGLNITFKTGKIEKNTPVDYYSLIEDLKIEKSIEKFNTKELNGLKLIKESNELFPKVQGYFHKKEKFSSKNKIKELWEDLFFLLKFYSAGKSSNRIEYIYSKDYIEIYITLFNLDFIQKHESCFYVNKDENLCNFISSTYPNYLKEKENEKIAFHSFIHYMSLLNGNSEDFELLNSFVAFEILAVGNGIILNNDTFLTNRLKKLLKTLELDENKINDFFNKYLPSIDTEDYIQFIIDTRSNILHGSRKRSYELSLLIKTFLTILSLKMLEIDCDIYLQILDKKCETKKFVKQFELDEKIDEDLISENIVKITKINDSLYLPLNLENIEDNINSGDKYRLVTFKTLDDTERCMRNIKINKRS